MYISACGLLWERQLLALGGRPRFALAALYGMCLFYFVGNCCVLFQKECLFLIEKVQLVFVVSLDSVTLLDQFVFKRHALDFPCTQSHSLPMKTILLFSSLSLCSLSWLPFTENSRHKVGRQC